MRSAPGIGKPKPKANLHELDRAAEPHHEVSRRRLTRLTNAFSKKLDNLKAAAALHFAHYNLCRIHGSLRVTPAMAAGMATCVWEIADLLPN